MTKKTKTYIIAILIPLLVGGLSALLTMGNMDIYSKINMPAFSPPPILFPIVWSVLYVHMGISSGIVYLRRATAPEDARTGLIFYGLNLFFNFFWSIIFFNLRAFTFSLWWLVVLWVVILAMIVYFRKVSPLAAFLQIPYLLWVTFAIYLNFMVSVLN